MEKKQKILPQNFCLGVPIMHLIGSCSARSQYSKNPCITTNILRTIRQKSQNSFLITVFIKQIMPATNWNDTRSAYLPPFSLVTPPLPTDWPKYFVKYP